MPNTYVALRTETVAVATGTVTFDLTGISGYTDLVLVAYMKPVSGGNNNALLRFNNDSGSNYSATYLAGDGSTASSVRGTSNTGLFVSYGNANGSNEPIFRFNIQNYSNSTTFKTTLNRNDAAGGWTSAIVGLWRNTAAITRLDIVTTNTNIGVGSTFSLYGIANADQGSAKATGGIITEDSQYWYHTFGASGAFIPKQSLTCDILQIAGGGGGGFTRGGAGGAGGLLLHSAQSLTATSYNVTVGAGGAAGTSGNGGTGVNSQFASLTASAGGGGGASGSITFSVGLPGGSGGGATGSGSGSFQAGGAATPAGQGSAGGGSLFVNFAAGGGGATVAGADATSTAPGNGGNGSSAYSSWGIATGTGQNIAGTVWYAGGGGGGRNSAGTGALAGNGGGGAGGATADQVGFSGNANTGGGGGGGANTTIGVNGGAGGSGIVIVRYSK